MNRQLIELSSFTTPEHACGYLPYETEALHYRTIGNLTPATYQGFLSRGWRRFGNQLFRPACRNCSKCRSLRVLVNDFRPSKSQRRTLQRNSTIEVVVRPPSCTRQHLLLYNAYHSDMLSRRGWQYYEISENDYSAMFISGREGFGQEFAYFSYGQLVGVGLVDALPAALSSVYFYHDPSWRSSAPGVFSVLKELEFARDHGIDYLYLGYWIAECQSMAYKSQYRPHEILQQSPADDEDPVWLRQGGFAPPDTGGNAKQPFSSSSPPVSGS
jgi:leucyl-tRNA---protein transferase